MNANVRTIVVLTCAGLTLASIAFGLQPTSQQVDPDTILFSRLLHETDQGHVHDVLIEGPQISGTFADGRSFQTYAPDDPSLVQRLYAKRVSITARPQPSQRQ